MRCVISTGITSGLAALAVLSLGTTPMFAQDTEISRDTKVAVVALISAAATAELERAAAIVRSDSVDAIPGDDLSLTASCVNFVSEEFYTYIKKIDYKVLSDMDFFETPIFAILQEDGITTFKMNAGNQVWLSDTEVYEISLPEFRFLEGMFRSLVLEKGCLAVTALQK